ncbi:FUSC family protein [Bradyrhizobium sp. WSM 1704]|uniref:FUSC family protein n=1 Tax=Bradyrhizobium semiaridum TaxID=2821404 RepID=UPI001CE285D0|nr:FUSC family protein [Bradyrhizobium semiaridum]MCA6121431.1 FUSC family protein [Bradyrhizobium semiaridum]
MLLAILFAHAICVANVSWAAYSGYMVMRGHVAESTLRGVLRFLGICAGAACTEPRLRAPALSTNEGE